MTMKSMMAALLAGAVLAGCQSAGTGETLGTLGGAAAGGVIGAQFGSGSGQLAATAAGTLLGAFAGNQLGAQFDQPDYYASNSAGQQAFNSGQPTTWTSPQSGYYGQVQPTGGSYYQNGRECRNFSQTVYIQGQPTAANGVACRNPDGSWSVVNYN